MDDGIFTRNAEAIRRINETWEQAANTGLLGERDRFGRNFICTSCPPGHGVHTAVGTSNHPAGEGKLVPNKNVPGRFHCFSCGFDGDVIDVTAAVHGCSRTEALIKAADVLSVPLQDSGGWQPRTRDVFPVIDERPAAPPEEAAPASDAKQVDTQTDRTVEIRFFAASLPGSDGERYLQRRGISLRTAQRLGIGYAAEWKHPDLPPDKEPFVPTSPRIIFPTGRCTYTARDIRPAEAIPEASRRYAKQNVGRDAPPFGSALLYGWKPVFITEGESDALSVLEVGGSAVSTGGTSGVKALLKLLGEMQMSGLKLPPLIEAMDADAAGRKAADALRAGLEKMGIYCLAGVTGELYAGAKDANGALQMDRQRFAVAVQGLTKRAAAEAALPGAGRLRVPIIPALSFVTDGTFDSINREFQQYKDHKTGFALVDADGPFYPGVYTIAAITSLGKTTFALQLACNVAAQTRPTLYVALEQSATELTAKALSRTMCERWLQSDPGWKGVRHPATAMQIREGYDSEELAAARDTYLAQIAPNLHFLTAAFGLTARDVVAAADAVADSTGTPPFVVVDYLQALAPLDVKATTRDNVTWSMEMLKQWQLEASGGAGTVLFVSSVNRANYLSRIDFDSFKESGGIEFTADVVWGLDLACIRHPFFDVPNKINKKREIVKSAKSEYPREIVLAKLKSRFGNSSEDYNFNYYAAYDCFVSVIEFKPKPNGWRSLIPKKDAGGEVDEMPLGAQDKKALDNLRSGNWAPKD